MARTANADHDQTEQNRRDIERMVRETHELIPAKVTNESGSGTGLTSGTDDDAVYLSWVEQSYRADGSRYDKPNGLYGSATYMPARHPNGETIPSFPFQCFVRRSVVTAKGPEWEIVGAPGGESGSSGEPEIVSSGSGTWSDTYIGGETVSDSHTGAGLFFIHFLVTAECSSTSNLDYPWITAQFVHTSGGTMYGNLAGQSTLAYGREKAKGGGTLSAVIETDSGCAWSLQFVITEDGADPAGAVSGGGEWEYVVINLRPGS